MKNEQKRITQMEKCIPDIWDHKIVLYIGAYPERFHFSNKLNENNCIVDVLEIDKNRCEGLRVSFPWVRRILNEDVRFIDRLDVFSDTPNHYDMVIWSHGPMILKREDIATTLKKLEERSKLIVILSIWGKYNHKKDVREIDEIHTPLYEEDFSKLGYKVSTIGQKDKNGSNLLAWKYKE